MEVDSKCIKRVFAEWLIADGLPFNALEGRGFHQLLTFLRPDIESYPGRRTVIKELPIMTSQLEITLRVEMETALAVSVQDFELPYFASARYSGKTPRKKTVYTGEALAKRRPITGDISFVRIAINIGADCTAISIGTSCDGRALRRV